MKGCLWQTKFVYVTKKKPKRAKNTVCFLLQFWRFLALFVHYLYIFFCMYWHFLALYNNSVYCSDSVRQTKNPCVAGTQCEKQNKSFSQWLSATNNIKKNIFNFFVACDKEIERKKQQKKTSIQIWISPPLSNCFGVPWKCFCTSILPYYFHI